MLHLERTNLTFATFCLFPCVFQTVFPLFSFSVHSQVPQLSLRARRMAAAHRRAAAAAAAVAAAGTVVLVPRRLHEYMGNLWHLEEHKDRKRMNLKSKDQEWQGGVPEFHEALHEAPAWRWMMSRKTKCLQKRWRHQAEWHFVEMIPEVDEFKERMGFYQCLKMKS